MSSHRKTVVGSAVTATTRAQTGTIDIPEGRGGVVTMIEAIAFGTMETVVNSGGKVEIECDGLDWKPFEFFIGGNTCVTEGGSEKKPTVIPVHKWLPAGSTLTVFYTPIDDQSQKLAVTVHWETHLSFDPSRETFMKGDLGTAITQTTVDADHNTITIPADKGGTVVAVQVIVWGTLETIVDSGGLVALKNESANPSWQPFEFYTHLNTCVDAGGSEITGQIIPCELDLPARSTVDGDFTPQDNQSQLLSLTVIWERRKL